MHVYTYRYLRTYTRIYTTHMISCICMCVSWVCQCAYTYLSVPMCAVLFFGELHPALFCTCSVVSDVAYVCVLNVFVCVYWGVTSHSFLALAALCLTLCMCVSWVFLCVYIGELHPTLFGTCSVVVDVAFCSSCCVFRFPSSPFLFGSSRSISAARCRLCLI